MAATAIAGVMSGNVSDVSWMQFGRKVKKQNKMNRIRVFCSSSSVTDPYKILRIRPDASESDVRKAYRHLALQYHPDVCKGRDCGVEFHQINQAYDVAMTHLREEANVRELRKKREASEKKKKYKSDYVDESFRGMHDPDWQYWEEWMGYEGASGINDYSNHINPFI